MEGQGGPNSMEDRMGRMEQMVATLAEMIRNQPPPQPINPQPAPQNLQPENPIPHGEIGIRDFQKMKPPTFEGGLDVLEAESWILKMEKIFGVIGCSETHKVTLATFNLDGEAHQWWNMQRELEANITWTRFLEIFNDKYFPQCIRDSKCSEFQRLKQEGTVAEYDAAFTHLSKYAPHMVATANRKARKFEEGLAPEIAKSVRLLRLPTYVEVLDRALMVEKDMAEEKKRNEESKKRNNPTPRENYGNDNYKRQNTGGNYRGGFNGRGQRTRCVYCQKYHLGECWQRPGACYKCGQMGHMMKDCPMLAGTNGGNNNNNNNNNNNRVNNHRNNEGNNKPAGGVYMNNGELRQGRVYALYPGDEKNDNNPA